MQFTIFSPVAGLCVYLSLYVARTGISLFLSLWLFCDVFYQNNINNNHNNNNNNNNLFYVEERGKCLHNLPSQRLMFKTLD